MLMLINPIARAEPFDHADWLFEPKYDGFRAAADTVRSQLISRNGNRMTRFEAVLDLLPKGHVFDGELVVLDAAGRPQFDDLLFGRGCPTYVAFDLLMADGVDLRPLPLKDRKAALARLGKRAKGWIALTNGVVGEGRALYRAVVDADSPTASIGPGGQSIVRPSKKPDQSSSSPAASTGELMAPIIANTAARCSR